MSINRRDLKDNQSVETRVVYPPVDQAYELRWAGIAGKYKIPSPGILLSGAVFPFRRNRN
jgi:hypothetical protein